MSIIRYGKTDIEIRVDWFHLTIAFVSRTMKFGGGLLTSPIGGGLLTGPIGGGLLTSCEACPISRGLY